MAERDILGQTSATSAGRSRLAVIFGAALATVVLAGVVSFINLQDNGISTIEQWRIEVERLELDYRDVDSDAEVDSFAEAVCADRNDEVQLLADGFAPAGTEHARLIDVTRDLYCP